MLKPKESLKQAEDFLNPEQKLYALSIHLDSFTFDGRDLDNKTAIQVSKKIKSITREIESRNAWSNTEDEMPITFETGHWDGERSEKLVVRTEDHQTLVARLYSGILDGSEFEIWYDKDDSEINNVKAWIHIPPYM